VRRFTKEHIIVNNTTIPAGNENVKIYGGAKNITDTPNSNYNVTLIGKVESDGVNDINIILMCYNNDIGSILYSKTITLPAINGVFKQHIELTHKELIDKVDTVTVIKMDPVEPSMINILLVVDEEW